MERGPAYPMPAVEPDELERDNQPRDVLEDADLRQFMAAEGLDDERPKGGAELDAWIDKRLAVLAAIEERIDQNNEAARLRIEMIERWRDDQNASLERQRDYLVRILEDAARAYPYPKNAKSRALPFGTVGVKNQPEKLKVEDKDAAIAFAQGHELLSEKVKIKYDIAHKDLKEFYDSTGIVPDGCVVEPKRENVPYVKVGR